MCFSAPVSFATSAALSYAGGKTLRHARPHKRLVALIPFFFAVQQAIEGVQWLVEKPSTCSQILGYGFLFFAFLVWPIWLPLSVWYAEHVAWRKRVLLVMLGAGMTMSAYLLTVLFHEPLSIVPRSASLLYGIEIPYFFVGVCAYVLVTTGSFLVSSDRKLRMFGALSFIAAAIAWIVFSYAFTSVWCFFAAALSVWLFWWGKR